MIRRAIGKPWNTCSLRALVTQAPVEAFDRAFWTGFPGAM
jgi:hypothetical protein